MGGGKDKVRVEKTGKWEDRRLKGAEGKSKGGGGWGWTGGGRVIKRGEE